MTEEQVAELSQQAVTLAQENAWLRAAWEERGREIEERGRENVILTNWAKNLEVLVKGRVRECVALRIRLEKVVRALESGKCGIRAIEQRRAINPSIVLSGVGDDIDAALAAAQPEEESRG